MDKNWTEQEATRQAPKRSIRIIEEDGVLTVNVSGNALEIWGLVPRIMDAIGKPGDPVQLREAQPATFTPPFRPETFLRRPCGDLALRKCLVCGNLWDGTKPDQRLQPILEKFKPCASCGTMLPTDRPIPGVSLEYRVAEGESAPLDLPSWVKVVHP